MTDVRLNTERIEAAAKAMYELTGGKWERLLNKENALYRMGVALAAADAAGSWNDTERLRERLELAETAVDNIEWWLRDAVASARRNDNDVAAGAFASALTWCEVAARATKQVRLDVESGDTERLRTALASLVDASAELNDALFGDKHRPDDVTDAISDIGDAMSVARAALAASVPSPPPKGRK